MLFNFFGVICLQSRCCSLVQQKREIIRNPLCINIGLAFVCPSPTIRSPLLRRFPSQVNNLRAGSMRIDYDEYAHDYSALNATR